MKNIGTKLATVAFLVGMTSPAFAGKGGSAAAIRDAINSRSQDAIIAEVERAESLMCGDCVTLVAERPRPQGASLLYDRIGRLPERLSATRCNPYSGLVREIGVVGDDGTVLRVLTNDLDATAEEVAALYRRRWAVELFFRWVKQTLKIRHFLGRSENAVRIQIAVALIAYLLLHLARQACRIGQSPLAFARLVRANLLHRRDLDQLLVPPTPPPNDPPQLSLTLTQA